MKKPIVIISDIHGCYKTLLKLIDEAKLRWGEFDLYFAGDLIDRGPDSAAVVKYAIDNNIPTCKGNHEDLCLDYGPHFERGFKSVCGAMYDYNIWLQNGGNKALESWGHYIPAMVLHWMQNLPVYFIPDAEPDNNGRKLLISHTGYGLDADLNTQDGIFRAIWARHGHDCDMFVSDGQGNSKDDGYFRVFGHTQQVKPWITDTFAMIDTGAAYKSRGLGKLTAFHWPSKDSISVDTID